MSTFAEKLEERVREIVNEYTHGFGPCNALPEERVREIISEYTHGFGPCNALTDKQEVMLGSDFDKQRLERVATAVLAGINAGSGGPVDHDARRAVRAARALIAELDKEPS